MKKIYIYFFLILFLFRSLTLAQYNLQISAVINEVNADSLMENLKILTGEKAITLNTAPVFILSRHKDNIGNSQAALFIKKKLLEYGLKTYVQEFLGTGENVYAVQPGVEKPNQKIIICAHYDSMPPGAYSPGADDNGSGTAAVLEAARILSKIKTKYTVIYALWDQEEQGLQGSNYYANQVSLIKDSIVAVINLDMIGWDSNNDFKAEIHTQNIANSVDLAQKMFNVNSLYNIGLNASIVNPGTNRSDHASFWTYKYSAVLLIESFQDFNPYYHQTLDRIDKINKIFFSKCARLAIGTLAYYAGIAKDTLIISEKPTFFQLYQNYPNPFNASTKIRYNVSKETHVKLVVYDALGTELAVLVNQTQQPNVYEIDFDVSRFGVFASGVYFYALYSGDYFAVRKMVLAK